MWRGSYWPPLTLLNVARIDPGQKGQDLLLDVLSLEKWRHRKIQVEVAGGGDLRWLSAAIARKGLKDVCLLGHVDDLKEVWRRATYGIFPSRFEGMPLAMVEAMALGRPVIATDVAGHAEWIQNGWNGFLAEAPSLASLDSAMEKAWQDKARSAEMGANARATYERMAQRSPAEVFAETIRGALNAARNSD